MVSVTVRETQEQIKKLKKEKEAVILAHSYQDLSILEIADITGDSFALSVAAKDIPQKTVIVCGVRFMADTVKILSPEKTVILANPSATCPMAEYISPSRVAEYKQANPGHKVVAYINTSTDLKAVCDVCVTSSSAVKIVKNIKETDILFIPDKNLGGYVKSQVSGKNITLWDGMCPVHDSVTEEDCIVAKKLYPNAKMLMHPELPQAVLAYADFIGSTSGILEYAKNSKDDCIIGTEKSISDILSLMFPDRRFPLLSKSLMCHDMRITNISDVLSALNGGGEEIVIEEDLRLLAKRPIDEMIRLSSI